MAMDMDFRWITKPYEDADKAKSIAEQTMAEHRAYNDMENLRQEWLADQATRQQMFEAAQEAKARAEAEQQRHFEVGNPYTMFNPNTASKDEIKDMQRMIGVKADGSWGKKSKAAFDNHAVSDDEWVQIKQASQLADQMRQRQRDYQEYQELLAEKRELEAKREKFLNSPQMQMAMALARGGQYGALQGMLMNEASGAGGKKKTQADMDALEKSLLTDIYAISGEKDANKRNKLQQMVRLIYGGQMADMLENNPDLVSRIGGLEAIEDLLGEQQGIVDDNKKKAEKSKATVKSLLNKISGGNG